MLKNVNIRIVVLVILVTCFCVGSVVAQDPPSGTVAKPTYPRVAPAPTQALGIAFATADFHGALILGNYEQLNVLMAEKFEGTMLDGSVLNRTSVLEQVAIQKRSITIALDPPAIREDEVTVTGRVIIQTDEGNPKFKKRVFLFKDIWRKHGDKWLVSATTMTYEKAPTGNN